MCRLIEELVKEENAAVIAEEKRKTALRMLARKTFSTQEIAELLDLDIAVVEELSQKTLLNTKHNRIPKADCRNVVGFCFKEGTSHARNPERTAFKRFTARH